MGRKVKLNNILSINELESLYRSSKDAVYKSHLQIIILYLQGKSTKEIIEITHLTSRWQLEILRRYNRKGLDGIKDARHSNPGRKSLLSKEQEDELKQELKKAPTDGGLWNGPKVAIWISDKLNRKVAKARGWEYLLKLGYTLKKPRPTHEKSDKKEQEAFKKNLWIK